MPSILPPGLCRFRGGCDRSAYVAGLCRLHHEMRRTGQELVPLPPKRPPIPNRELAVSMTLAGANPAAVAAATGLERRQVSDVREGLRRQGHYIKPRGHSRKPLEPSTYASDLEAAKNGGPRCRCGLLLPCNNCLPEHAHEYVQTLCRPDSRPMPSPPI